MFTFLQFIIEAKEQDINPFGFLRPGHKGIHKKGKDRNKWNHYRIAKHHGFENHREPIRKHGWVRYEQLHNWGGMPDVSHYAGYEFRHDPESKQMVADHIRKSGKLDRIVFDVHHPDGIKSHTFNTNGEALRHLDN